MCASSANSVHSLLQRPRSLSSLSLFSPSLPRCSFLPASNEPRRRRRPLRVEDDILQWPTISCIHSFLFFIRMPLLPSSYLRMAPFTCRFPLMTTHSAIIEMRVVKKKCESLLFPRPAKKADLAIVTISKNSQPQHILISFMPLYRTGRLRLLASYSMLM